MSLKCPSIQSSKFLCDDPAEYSVDGVVLCGWHARGKMAKKLEAENDARYGKSSRIRRAS